MNILMSREFLVNHMTEMQSTLAKAQLSLRRVLLQLQPVLLNTSALRDFSILILSLLLVVQSAQKCDHGVSDRPKACSKLYIAQCQNYQTLSEIY